MNTRKFSKNDLLFFYQKYDFPSKLIDKDILKIKEIIFTNENFEPENNNYTKKKLKLANSFIVEEEIEPKKNPLKKGKTTNKPEIYQKNNNQFNNNPTWRKAEPDVPGFFDDFKGKSDEKQVLTFKRNLELVEKTETSISILKTILLDHLEIVEKDFFDSVKKENKSNNSEKNLKNSAGNSRNIQPKEITASADDLFSDEGIFSNINNSSNGNISKNKNEGNVKDEKINSTVGNNIISYLNADPKKIEFKNAYKINDYLKYGREQPLWYIFHPIAKSSFGPCSTENLEEMYNGSMVDGQSEIRFIDIYNLKNKKPFSFFKLKELDNEKIFDNIEISSLLSNALALNGKSDKNQK